MLPFAEACQGLDREVRDLAHDSGKDVELYVEGGEVELDRPFGRCGCGSSDLEWLSGDELRVRELEVA